MKKVRKMGFESLQINTLAMGLKPPSIGNEQVSFIVLIERKTNTSSLRRIFIA